MTRKQLMHKSIVQTIQKNIGTPLKGCEVGVYSGELSFELLRNFETLTLYMVDCYLQMRPWTTAAIQEAMQKAFSRTLEFDDRRMMLIGKSVQMAHLIPDKSLDFVFIDAAHNLKSVTEDIKAWYPKVRSGGLISGHDYNERHYGGVMKAVDQFTQDNNYVVKTLRSKCSNWWFLKR